MKGFSILLPACTLCVGMAHADTVTLTRDDVGSSRDIQLAIYKATHFGTIPGTVVFDGRKGEFSAPSPGLEVKIPVSNLTLAGINGATITNCVYGVTIQRGMHDILIEGMRFDCNASQLSFVLAGIIAEEASDVTIRNNVFDVGGLGIRVYDGSGWKIQDNVIKSTYVDGEPASAIRFDRVTNSEIIGNSLKGIEGVTLGGGAEDGSASRNKVLDNRIEAQETGIRLWAEARDVIMLNQIRLTTVGEGVGIDLAGDTARNLVLWNRTTSTSASSLQGVVDNGRNNKVSGNQP